MVLENVRGNYGFIRGIGPFSAAVVARPGFEIVSARFHPFVPLAHGYDLVERHLSRLARPINALCGMHLRIPAPLSRAAFDEFNRPYIERVNSWGLEVEGANPVARTNVALEASPVPEPMLAGFFYTIASDAAVPTFLLSGAPEISSRAGATPQIVARGDTSADGIRAKTECVLEVLTACLNELQLGWNHATAVNFYTVHGIHALLPAIVAALGHAALGGIRLHYARPPVTGLEVEIDACAVGRELVLRE
jgi:hypothetical protein